MNQERSYIIGTHDAEIARLAIQHRVWRASTLDLWRKAGITAGKTVIDAGAGPGYAALDLAEIVGLNGRVIAVERSRRFLDTLEREAGRRGLSNIETVEADLLELDWSRFQTDHLWCRWVLTFLPDPARAVEGFAKALKPGGAAILQEYYDYASWRLAPCSEIFESYVARIIAGWRAGGGEPDIALALPHLLARHGLAVDKVRPVIFAAGMANDAARWPMGFARDYLPTLIAAGTITQAEAGAVIAELDRAEADPDALMLTPGVLQFIARKPR
jgi:ubiquinone/menaquinone biosynthesis C-methylase UbiE